MLFNSIQFIFIFLPLCLFIFYFTKKYLNGTYSLLFLLFASLFFYAWWNPEYIFLLLFSLLLNLLLTKELMLNRSRSVLIFGIFLNLLILGYFKYRIFFLENVNIFIDNKISLSEIYIPLGISFFTFQQIAFLIDIYNQQVKYKKNIEFLTFVSFFPQLIAGPIVLFKEVREQINSIIKNKNINIVHHLTLGFYVFSIGLFKKVVLADSIAPFTDYGFILFNKLTFIEAWLISIGYSLQLYFDFSGYSDMAIGLGLMFGFKLPQNFETPFRASSMINFWKKWHITMTRFFMFYLFFPIALSITRALGNTNVIAKFIICVAFPIIITFFLSGLWHGANWTFVLFGLVNAFGLIVNYFWREFGFFRINFYISWLLTILTIIVSFVFFRSPNTVVAITMLKTMFSFDSILLPSFMYSIAQSFNLDWVTMKFLNNGTYSLKYLILLILLSYFSLNLKNVETNQSNFIFSWKKSFFCSLIFVLSIILLDRPQAFIYFQF